MGKTFTVNGAKYATDAETLDLLKGYASTNPEAFGMVLTLGTAYGRIVRLDEGAAS